MCVFFVIVTILYTTEFLKYNIYTKTYNVWFKKCKPFYKRGYYNETNDEKEKYREVFLMLIQSKKVWIADQFIAAQIEVWDGKITEILPYGSKTPDVDYGDKRIVP